MACVWSWQRDSEASDLPFTDVLVLQASQFRIKAAFAVMTANSLSAHSVSGGVHVGVESCQSRSFSQPVDRLWEVAASGSSNTLVSRCNH